MRNTPQTTVIRQELQRLGHATNHQLWQAAQGRVDGLSLSSVHRITQRLRRQGDIGCVPNLDGECIVDNDPRPHGHFMCRHCRQVTDLELAAGWPASINQRLASVEATDLLVTGRCQQCRS